MKNKKLTAVNDSGQTQDIMCLTVRVYVTDHIQINTK